ncbi:MAG: Gfo/Idh/MocA family oxidoreductase [Bryobacteraceae bacterium]|nr:Gfo/Idh/MocA family oxidoreductase [Bryobacteraceae bacterium]
MSLTRRTLVAGALTVSALSSSESGAEPARVIRLGRKIRLVMAGFEGHTGEITDPLPQMPDVELAGVAGGQADFVKLVEKLRLAGVSALPRRYDSLEAMLAAEKPDVAAICNTNGARADAIIYCAERRVHVIAEKPLAIDRVSFERVRNAVQQSGIELGLLLPMRFEPPFAALKKIVDEGSIGEVIQVSGQKSYKFDSPAWRRSRASYGSTILWIGIHVIDLMRWTSGRELVDATGWQTRVGFPELKDQENVSASVFRMDNGGLAILRMDFLRSRTAATHGDDRLRLAGTKGVAEYMAATGVTLLTDKSGLTTVEAASRRGSVLQDFLEGVYLKKARNITTSDIWRVNEITLSAHESAAQGAKLLRI